MDGRGHAELRAVGIRRSCDRGLRKYKDSKDLTVAIHLNRGIKGFNPSEVKVPQLNIAALWIYGGISPDKSRWAIWGNFLDELQASEFSYPS